MGACVGTARDAHENRVIANPELDRPTTHNTLCHSPPNKLKSNKLDLPDLIRLTEDGHGSAETMKNLPSSLPIKSLSPSPVKRSIQFA